MYSIVDENADFWVVNKHHGVCIHTEDEQLGLIAQLKADLSCDEVYPVHRLDKVTSGLILCAKHAEAASVLSQLFQHRNIEKYYLALSNKKPKKKQGLVKGDMERSRRSSWRLNKEQKNPATTQFFSYSLSNGVRLFLLKPRTGRTHQLRVALKSLGSPIIGDRLYGGLSYRLPREIKNDDVKDDENKVAHAESERSDLLGGELDAMVKDISGQQGIYLHAYALKFVFAEQLYSYQLIPSHWGDIASSIKEQEAVWKQPWDLPWPSVTV